MSYAASEKSTSATRPFSFLFWRIPPINREFFSHARNSLFLALFSSLSGFPDCDCEQHSVTLGPPSLLLQTLPRGTASPRHYCSPENETRHGNYVAPRPKKVRDDGGRLSVVRFPTSMLPNFSFPPFLESFSINWRSDGSVCLRDYPFLGLCSARVSRS